MEMLLVIAIISILAALLLPALSRARLRARSIQCRSHLHQIAVAFENYSTDNESRYPWDSESRKHTVAGFRDVFGEWQDLEGYLASAEVLHCPADTRLKPAITFPELGPADISYTLLNPPPPNTSTALWATDRNLNQYEFNGQSVQQADWQTDRRAHHGFNTGNILLGDGSAHSVQAKGLRQALSDSLQLAAQPRLDLLRAGVPF